MVDINSPLSLTTVDATPVDTPSITCKLSDDK